MCKGDTSDGEEKANYKKISDCRILDTVIKIIGKNKRCSKKIFYGRI